MDEYNVILKNWRDRKGCPKSPDGRHWACYVFLNGADKKYWCDQHFDETNQCWWRHYDFMSIPCSKCGAYSPLRCSNQFSINLDGHYDKKACPKKKVIDYRPGDTLPDDIAYYRENGWSYIFFKKTLSDSLCGQETFVLKSLPDTVRM